MIRLAFCSRRRLALFAVIVFSAIIPAALAYPAPAGAQSDDEVFAPAGFVVEPVIEKLDGPTAFAFAPDGRIFVTQKSGVVRSFADGRLLRENFLDLGAEVNYAYNRGLVGIALDPGFPAAPYVYLAYAYQPREAGAHKAGGARLSRVARVTVDPADPNRAQPGSMVVLLGAGGEFEQIGNPDRSDSEPLSCLTDEGRPVRDCIPVEGTAHQANTLQFGRDGALYVSVGDGAEQAAASLRAQDLDSLSGKILRINPLNGNGYASNPFYNRDPTSNRAKIFMLGLRNPFRFTFHPQTGELYIGDVGQSAWEEIDRGRAGANFGWPCFEGPEPAADEPICAGLRNNPRRATLPLYVFPHTEGRVAITGGDFYTGTAFPAAYRSAYFFGEYNTGVVSVLGAGGGATVQEFAGGFSGLVQISSGPDGSLYVLSIRKGTLYRIRWRGAN